MTEADKTYMMICYVPVSACEKVKQALFAAGAGKIGNYESCCWQTEGLGQFKPLPGSSPTIGETNKVATVPEVKIELIVTASVLKPVLMALKSSHPYETPAFYIIETLRTS